MEGHFYSSPSDPWDLETITDFRNGQTVNTEWLYIFPDSPSTRYRQVPTFRKDTIRRFQENSSELKKMTARDFEDLLQVHRFWVAILKLLTVFMHSVLFLSSKISFPSPTTLRFNGFCSCCVIGTPSRSSACTRTILLMLWNTQLFIWLSKYADFLPKHARLLTQKSSDERLSPVGEGLRGFLKRLHLP